MDGIRVDPTSHVNETLNRVGSSGQIPYTEQHHWHCEELRRTGSRRRVASHQYISLEGPEAGTCFRGRGRFHDGTVTITVPEDFRIVTDPDGLSFQITPIGQMTNVAVISADLDHIVVRAARDVEFYYHVNGARKAYKDFQPILIKAEEHYFVPNGPNDRIENLGKITDEIRNRLISNGTYNEDGSVNLQTAERMGWAQEWRNAEATRQAYVESRPNGTMKPLQPPTGTSDH